MSPHLLCFASQAELTTIPTCPGDFPAPNLPHAAIGRPALKYQVEDAASCRQNLLGLQWRGVRPRVQLGWEALADLLRAEACWKVV